MMLLVKMREPGIESFHARKAGSSVNRSGDRLPTPSLIYLQRAPRMRGVVAGHARLDAGS
jgi:hypothetical protein